MHSNHEYLKLIFKNLNRSKKKKNPSKYDQKKKDSEKKTREKL